MRSKSTPHRFYHSHELLFISRKSVRGILTIGRRATDRHKLDTLRANHLIQRPFQFDKMLAMRRFQRIASVFIIILRYQIAHF